MDINEYEKEIDKRFKRIEKRILHKFPIDLEHMYLLEEGKEKLEDMKNIKNTVLHHPTLKNINQLLLRLVMFDAWAVRTQNREVIKLKHLQN